MSRERVLSRIAAATATVALLSSAAGVAAAAPPTDPCPDVFPVASLTDGQALTGLTTDRGSTPTEFTATVLGVLDDGIAPDVDMILVDAHSAAIDKVGGIWQGMSGSPVYSADGRLVGAIAYGLSFGSSSIAGVTPAAEMRRLHGGGSGGVAVAESVPLPAKLAARVVARGSATTAEASSGLAPLGTPVGVSGLSQRRLDQAGAKLERFIPGALVYRAASASAQVAAAAPVPGAPMGAVLAYGDYTAGGIGTVTDVCGSSVAAFGHPLLFAGKYVYSAHPASAVVVQPDSFGAAFVVANLGLPPWGTVDQDRQGGIHATVGPLPPTTVVTSSLAGLDSGVARDGRTDVVNPDYVAEGTFWHLVVNLDRVLDRVGDGTTKFSWTATGTHNGAAWSVTRNERLGSASDASYEAAGQVANLVQYLTSSAGGQVTVADVTASGSGTETFDGATVTRLQVRLPSGAWVDASSSGEPVPAVAGARLQVRVVLTKKDGTTTVLPLSLAVEPAAVGRIGVLSVDAGPRTLGCDPEAEEPCATPTFDEALADVKAAPTGDTVQAQLTEMADESGAAGGSTAAADDDAAPLAPPVRVTASQLVSGSALATVQIVAPRAAAVGVVSGGAWSLRSSASAGTPTTSFRWGRATDRPVMGDWDGNGTATPGIYRDGAWYLRNGLTSGDRPSVRFGQAGDSPVVGDWDGDGDDDLGVYRSGTFLLQTGSTGQVSFVFGAAGDQPVAGDWDGDGVDTVGVFRAGTWYLRNSLAAGAPDVRAVYGRAGDRPVVGDWDRNGTTDLGVFRTGTWYSRSSAGATAKKFAFGTATGAPVVWR